MTKGYKTTEFYLVLATNVAVLAASLADALPARYAAIAASVANVGYALARGLAKFQKLP